ncbi:hypothetical protein FH972_025144 [Carpinus fangiana]|uniref:Uncharacterized protein n=1 Tax=Carpinus fangiana TaxID=176857 RepID=A0A5N6L0E3_9ROSI|nr:hypothetical protein FH972_025144 [Carpinus fangiana]
MAAAARLGYQFAGALPKEQMLELANERNRVKLPVVDKDTARFGVRLPPERFVLSGQGWQVPEEWDDEMGSDDEEGEGEANGVEKVNGNGVHAGENGVKDDGDEDMVDEGEGQYEDVFGEEGADEDKMED